MCDACVCGSLCVSIWCLGQSGSLPIVYESVSESHGPPCLWDGEEMGPLVAPHMQALWPLCARAFRGVSARDSLSLVACQPLTSVTSGS